VMRAPVVQELARHGAETVPLVPKRTYA
jgi:hypothetical protein